VIFQSVSECQYATWTTIVQFLPSRSTIFIFSPTLSQKLLNQFSPFFTRSRAISGAINACIHKTIVLFVSEHESEDWRQSILTLAKIAQNSLVTIATSPGLLQNLCQFYNRHIFIYQCWNISADWFSSCWDIRRYRPISAESQHNFHFLPYLNSKTANRFSPFFTRCRAISGAINARTRKAISHSVSEWQSDKCRGVGNFATIFLKIGCHGNVPWDIKKEVQIDHLHPKRFHSVKRLRKSVKWILR